MENAGPRYGDKGCGKPEVWKTRGLSEKHEKSKFVISNCKENQLAETRF